MATPGDDLDTNRDIKLAIFSHPIGTLVNDRISVCLAAFPG
jgi:hypothetical protein